MLLSFLLESCDQRQLNMTTIDENIMFIKMFLPDGSGWLAGMCNKVMHTSTVDNSSQQKSISYDVLSVFHHERNNKFAHLTKSLLRKIDDFTKLCKKKKNNEQV